MGRLYLGELVTIRGKRGEEWVEVANRPALCKHGADHLHC